MRGYPETGSALVIVPAPGVTVASDTWSRPEWGISVPTPPVAVSFRSSESDLDLAEAALRSGLAQTRNPARSLVIEFGAPFGPTRVMTVPRHILAIVRGALGAFVTVNWPVAVVFAVAFGSALVYPPIMGLVICLTLLPASIVIHELGHLLVFRAVSGRDTLGVFIVDRALPRLQRRDLRRGYLVTLAGPLATAILIVPCLALGLYATIAGAVVILGHLLSLLLPVGDGLQLRRELSQGSGGAESPAGARRETE